MLWDSGADAGSLALLFHLGREVASHLVLDCCRGGRPGAADQTTVLGAERGHLDLLRVGQHHDQRAPVEPAGQLGQTEGEVGLGAAVLEAGGRRQEAGEPSDAAPLAGVTVAVYGANNPYPDPGDFIASSATDPGGWYTLEVPDGYEFYHIRESDPPGYVSVGATSISGTVRTRERNSYMLRIRSQSFFSA